ncbi:hypothetical protein GGR92_003659 [Spirosoma lacussanchae]|uniref:hypothetical protein n=1 Tax=Spirosoma lacussanchae TaxID=1884249 RepID=UPI00110A0545|nr:hypothetical protein [Spirosoma lacussanchae]
MESATGIRGDARAEWLTSNRDAARILTAYIGQAENAFKSKIQAAGLTLTGELLASFRTTAATEGEGYVEVRLQMAGYGRIKDLRRMNYSRTPPLLAMEAFVEKVGVSHFAYVGGYPRGVFPRTESQTVERIAWSLKMSLARRPNVVRGYRGIYSDPLLNDVLPYLFRDLATACNLTASRAFKVAFSD